MNGSKNDIKELLNKYLDCKAIHRIAPVYDLTRKYKKEVITLTADFISRFIGQVQKEDKIDISTYDKRLFGWSDVIYIVKK